MNETVWSLSPEVVVTVLEDSAVLLELQTKYFYSVNATGWAIVQMFESGATKQQIAEKCSAWGADAARMDMVENFINSFEADNLIMPSEDTPTAHEITFEGDWKPPEVEKHKEPLERIMVSAFDPSLPLAE